MYPWFPEQPDDAISMLKRDHDIVKRLFKEFEDAKGAAEKRKVSKEALQELKVHAVLEEEIFYPTVRKQVGKDIMNEAAEEHHVAKVLIAELEAMDDSSDFYEAKFTVLAENIRHHIKEEEHEMLPKAEDLKIDFVELGQVMLRRKEQLLAEGVPAPAEAKMVASMKSRGDSPATAAKRRKPVAKAVKPQTRTAH